MPACLTIYANRTGQSKHLHGGENKGYNLEMQVCFTCYATRSVVKALAPYETCVRNDAALDGVCLNGIVSLYAFNTFCFVYVGSLTAVVRVYSHNAPLNK